MVIIDNKFYKVNNNEYCKLIHKEYNNLKMIETLEHLKLKQVKKLRLHLFINIIRIILIMVKQQQ